MKKITYLETGFHVNVPFKKKKKKRQLTTERS